MKGGMDWEGLKKGLDRYKYVLIVMVAGAVLLLIPNGEGGEEVEERVVILESNDPWVYDLGEIERKIEETLSKVEGAGEVSLVLTVQGSTRQVLAQNTSSSQNGEEKETVIIDQGSGVESGLTLQEIYPIYQGALLVCTGGDDPTVQYKMTQAISALTGLGADKITICKAE